MIHEREEFSKEADIFICSYDLAAKIANTLKEKFRIAIADEA